MSTVNYELSTPKNETKMKINSIINSIKPIRGKIASSTCVIPDITKFINIPPKHSKFGTQITKEDFIDIENKKEIDIKDIPLRCFICGSLFNLSGFESHYFVCKSNYINKNQVSNKKVNEPKNFGEFFNKMVIGIITRNDIDNYNKFADKYFWETMCKICKNCNIRINEDAYDKHVRNCLISNNSNNIIMIKVNKLKDKHSSVKSSEKEDLNLFNIDKEKDKKRSMRKKSMDDIRNYDMKQIRGNIKHYFI